MYVRRWRRWLSLPAALPVLLRPLSYSNNRLHKQRLHKLRDNLELELCGRIWTTTPHREDKGRRKKVSLVSVVDVRSSCPHIRQTGVSLTHTRRGQSLFSALELFNNHTSLRLSPHLNRVLSLTCHRVVDLCLLKRTEHRHVK